MFKIQNKNHPYIVFSANRKITSTQWMKTNGSKYEIMTTKMVKTINFIETKIIIK